MIEFLQYDMDLSVFRTDIIHTDFIWSGDKHVDLQKHTHTMLGLKRAFRTNSFYKSMHVSCSCMWYAIFQRNLKLAWSCYFLIFIFEHILITLLSAADISGLYFLLVAELLFATTITIFMVLQKILWTVKVMNLGLCHEKNDKKMSSKH